MSEQILTEEELAKLLMNSSERDLTEQEIFSMYDSHRLLLSANAELSFKNQKYKNLIEAVLQAHRERGAIMTEACGDREVVSQAYELEELK